MAWNKQNTRIKRSFDMIFTLIAFMIFAIPVILIVLGIKIFQGHSVFFCQERIGQNKIPFKLLKFQTLIDNIPTKLGKWLRKTGLDELPQFINVFNGEMSIVGPRALTNSEIARLKWDDDYYSLRWAVRPGITGFAQVFGGQNKRTSWFWDKKYIENAGIGSDFCMIVISFIMNILGKQKVRRLIWPDKDLE